MLPVHIEQLLREQIEVDLRTKGTKRRNLEQRAAHKAMQGRMHRPGVQALEILEEIGHRANLITEAIRKVLLEIKVAPYPELTADLLSLFDAEFNNVVREFRPRVTEIISRIVGVGGVNDGGVSEKIDDWRLAHRMEIKMLGAAIMEPARRASTISISVENSQVGAIQTGEGAVVGTGISITNEDSAKLLNALREFKDCLSTASGLNNIQRTELREIVTDVESELGKSKPNKTKIGALLSMVLATTKGIETVKTAYDTIAGILSALGIHLIS